MQERIASALTQIDDWIGAQGAPGVGAAVWQGGKVVAERYAGEARPGQPVGSDTLFPLASVTKPITAAAFMTLVDDGDVGLDEPVGRIVPEFRAGPLSGTEGVDSELERSRHAISARQLLCHVSGLPEDLGPRESRYLDKVDLDTVVDQMCQLPLVSAPGDVLRYSNAGYGVLARVIERIGGDPIWDLTRRRVLSPLGITDVIDNPTGETLDRVAQLRDTSHPGTDVETYNSPYWRSLALPWGGLFGAPRDVVRFAGAFLPSGGGTLSKSAISLMISDQTLGVAGGVESAKVHWASGRWGLGWEVKGEKRRHWTGELTSTRTYCHFGHAGTLVWGDPEHDLALAVFANRTVPHMWTFILNNWARLSNAVVAAAKH